MMPRVVHGVAGSQSVRRETSASTVLHPAGCAVNAAARCIMRGEYE